MRSFQMFGLLFLFGAGVALSGCSSDDEQEPQVTFREKLLAEYALQGRGGKYFELLNKYDSTVVLVLNRHSDRSGVVNWTAYIAANIIDLPEVAAIGGTLAIFYAVAWWMGVTLTGGGILAVLAFLGAPFQAWIPASITGVVFLVTMAVLLARLVSAVV